jgi:uncharacterized low-complexity protein
MRFMGKLIAASLASALVLAPVVGAAQELSLDPNALDTSSASAPKTKAKKASHAKKSQPQPAASAAPQKPTKVENRQFGELEGWSPGKTPPKSKDKQDPVTPGKVAPVSVSPSGGIAVGMPF